MQSYLSLIGDLKEVPKAREFAYEFMKDSGASEKDAHRTEFIVGEMCTNAIEHGGHGGKITLSLDVQDHSVVLECVNKVEVDTPLAEELNKRLEGDVHVNSKRGRGLYVIRHWSKEAFFEDVDGGIKIRVIQSF